MIYSHTMNSSVFGYDYRNIINSLRSPLYGHSPLCAAIIANKLDAMILLIEHGANVNKPIKQWSKYTPLHIAVMCNNEGAVRILMDHRANPRLTDRSFEDPIYLAGTREHDHLIKLMTT